MAKEKQEYDYVNPNHYKKFSMEVIDMMVSLWGKEKVANYCEINAFKYKMRLGEKPDQPIKRDMEKAKWYLEKAVELRSSDSNDAKSFYEARQVYDAKMAMEKWK